MEIILKNIRDIKPYEKNPRRNDTAVKSVMESIREFGFKVPLVIDKDNIVVTGHTRLKACIELGIKEIPCVIADDLTEEQVKAFRLADNKVSEIAEWDFNLLDCQLSEIMSIDMSQFGFDLSFDDEEEKEKTNERERTNNTYNLDMIDKDRVDGFYEMPIIDNDYYIPRELVGFNYAKTNEDKNVGIHFYLDDYQFERVWNKPSDYIELLKDYDCILSPDFSLYMDMPMSMKIWNIFRSRLIGQYMQDNGIRVIPTLSWAEEETFAFCFDGIPKGSIVSISTIGVKRDEEAMQVWKLGVDELIRKISPSTILIYGGEVDYDYGDIKVIYYDNQVTERMKD